MLSSAGKPALKKALRSRTGGGLPVLRQRRGGSPKKGCVWPSLLKRTIRLSEIPERLIRLLIYRRFVLRAAIMLNLTWSYICFFGHTYWFCNFFLFIFVH